jgi:His-Xaa-Ser system radical SAM maturase HxsB
MPLNIENVNYQKVGFFRFKKLKNDYLLTNDAGDYVFLEKKFFDKYLQGKLDKKSGVYKELVKKNFIRDNINFDSYVEKYASKHHYLFAGPSLHIIVTTLRCNYSCLYCQASSKKNNNTKFDLDLGTAKQIVDFIFSTPNPNIAIEFQGGEPLLNWPVVKFIVEYAKKKNESLDKNLELRLVSNFSLMDEEKMQFFFDNQVSLCTSIDGPEEVHNKNRPFLPSSSYQETTKWLGKAMDEFRKREKKKGKGKGKEKAYVYQPSALVTVSRYSLKYPKEIIDEYLKWGFESIFLRPLSPLGSAGKTWSTIGYTPEEYLKFYQKALDYILILNKKDKRFSEKTASIIATKILTDKDPNYLEMRSPCGAGLGQLAYDYNGDIFTCDEGRMMSYTGEKMFRLGIVGKNTYKEIIDNPVLKTMCLASETSCQTGCAHCVYQPYCGICPIYNFAANGSIFSQKPVDFRCKITQSIFDLIFGYLKDKKAKKIISGWVNDEISRGEHIRKMLFS